MLCRPPRSPINREQRPPAYLVRPSGTCETVSGLFALWHEELEIVIDSMVRESLPDYSVKAKTALEKYASGTMTQEEYEKTVTDMAESQYELLETWKSKDLSNYAEEDEVRADGRSLGLVPGSQAETEPEETKGLLEEDTGPLETSYAGTDCTFKDAFDKWSEWTKQTAKLQNKVILWWLERQAQDMQSVRSNLIEGKSSTNDTQKILEIKALGFHPQIQTWQRDPSNNNPDERRIVAKLNEECSIMSRSQTDALCGSNAQTIFHHLRALGFEDSSEMLTDHDTSIPAESFQGESRRVTQSTSFSAFINQSPQLLPRIGIEFDSKMSYTPDVYIGALASAHALIFPGSSTAPDPQFSSTFVFTEVGDPSRKNRVATFGAKLLTKSMEKWCSEGGENANADRKRAL
ncbi:hypothetical protein BD324DRAFT_649615 [Kockovaella imperatae]|uniref:Uncharacterized protein n=1 Tax=Kockovaella imperatae TaxID=4999 RepID=A0A1Y1UL77_9TREE|nr:hypothetical protein BD324DRAFT_649615 [Kockovaella imperatae]ORX38236.1 hypothetical protein BD324DRAFT_649615 [Kockovaella imperatae]